MIYDLKDPQKVEKLFADMDDTLIRACLQGVMGKVYVTDLEKPRSALAQLGRHLFYAGEPEREYTCLWLDDILDRTIDNPDRSQWDGYCGRYERRNEKPGSTRSCAGAKTPTSSSSTAQARRWT